MLPAPAPGGKAPTSPPPRSSGSHWQTASISRRIADIPLVDYYYNERHCYQQWPPMDDAIITRLPIIYGLPTGCHDQDYLPTYRPTSGIKTR